MVNYWWSTGSGIAFSAPLWGDAGLRLASAFIISSPARRHRTRTLAAAQTSTLSSNGPAIVFVSWCVRLSYVYASILLCLWWFPITLPPFVTACFHFSYRREKEFCSNFSSSALNQRTKHIGHVYLDFSISFRSLSPVLVVLEVWCSQAHGETRMFLCAW